MELNIVLLDKDCPPFKRYADDAGIDLRARIPKLISISQHSTVTILTGICVEIPKGHMGHICGRSSMNKAGIHCMIGTIDAGYTGEISVCLTNTTDIPFHVNPYDRIAQLIIMPIEVVNKINIVEKLAVTERADSGFGSTGK